MHFPNGNTFSASYFLFSLPSKLNVVDTGIELLFKETSSLLSNPERKNYVTDTVTLEKSSFLLCLKGRFRLQFLTIYDPSGQKAQPI